MKRLTSKIHSGSKGQSFVELSIVVLLLMLLVAGIAEFGVLLNRYLNLLDGVREAARYGANYDPFAPCPLDSSGNVVGTVNSDGICTTYYVDSAKEAINVIQPIELDSNDNDDLVLSILIVSQDASHAYHFCRFPSENGWSWSKEIEHHATPNHASAQPSSVSLEAQLTNGAEPVSALMVEAFYNYHQTLKAPFYEQVFPDPIPVYAFAIMPLKNANPPSPSPCHTGP
jgi:hypothetical protein